MSTVCERISKFVPDIKDQDAVIGFIRSIPITDDQKYSMLYEYEACSDQKLDIKIKKKYGL